MGAMYRGEPLWWSNLQIWLNLACTIIFTVEAGLKIAALGLMDYFRVGRNKFDFSVVGGSWVDIILQTFGIAMANTASLRIVRILVVIGRAARTMHVGSSVESLQLIFDTVLLALPQVMHIAILVLMIIFIFSVIGMKVLGRIALQGCLSENRNFQSTPTAMLTLFGLATGDSYVCMIHSCVITEDSGQCTEAKGDCGLPIGARVYFVAYTFFVLFTTIEMFVNVIISNYRELAEMNGLPVTDQDMRAFSNIWKAYDPFATGMIPTERLEQLLNEVTRKMPSKLGYNELSGEEEIDQ
jgi:hypothetical protein